MFRPSSDWEDFTNPIDNPTYGFDWYRENDTQLIGDAARIDTIMGFYHNNDTKTRFQPEDAAVIGNFKNEYRNVTIDRNGTPYRYFVPKLILYKNENEQVRSVATLDIIYNVYEEPNNLFIEYESKYFEVTEQAAVTVYGVSTHTSQQVPLPEIAYSPPESYKIFKIPSKSVGNHKSLTIEIECLKPFGDLNGKQIKAYALTEGTNGQPAQKKIVGVLDVMPNDKANRKVVKLLMVNVITNIDERTTADFGYDEQKLSEQKRYLRKYLRNSLIDPIFETARLDLGGLNTGDFTLRNEFNRNYAHRGKLFSKERSSTPLSAYLKRNLHTNPTDYIPIFFLSQKKFEDDPLTIAYYSPLSNVIVATNRLKPITIAHEVYHSLKLPHSFESKRHMPAHIHPLNRSMGSNGKFSFKRGETTNIMDHTTNNRNNLFYWQIKIVCRNATAEPDNYIPEQL